MAASSVIGLAVGLGIAKAAAVAGVAVASSSESSSGTETEYDTEEVERDEQQYDTTWLRGDEGYRFCTKWSELAVRYADIIVRCCPENNSVFIVPTSDGYKRENRLVELRDTEKKGVGVFAKLRLSPKHYFVYYGRQILQLEEFDGEYVIEVMLGRSNHGLPLRLFTDARPDLIETYNIPSLMFASKVNEPNPEETPNCEFQQIVDNERQGKESWNPYDKHVILRPIREILPGEELLTCYGPAYERSYKVGCPQTEPGAYYSEVSEITEDARKKTNTFLTELHAKICKGGKRKKIV